VPAAAAAGPPARLPRQQHQQQQQQPPKKPRVKKEYADDDDDEDFVDAGAIDDDSDDDSGERGGRRQQARRPAGGGGGQQRRAAAAPARGGGRGRGRARGGGRRRADSDDFATSDEDSGGGGRRRSSRRAAAAAAAAADDDDDDDDDGGDGSPSAARRSMRPQRSVRAQGGSLGTGIAGGGDRGDYVELDDETIERLEAEAAAAAEARARRPPPAPRPPRPPPAVKREAAPAAGGSGEGDYLTDGDFDDEDEVLDAGAVDDDGDDETFRRAGGGGRGRGRWGGRAAGRGRGRGSRGGGGGGRSGRGRGGGRGGASAAPTDDDGEYEPADGDGDDDDDLGGGGPLSSDELAGGGGSSDEGGGDRGPRGGRLGRGRAGSAAPDPGGAAAPAGANARRRRSDFSGLALKPDHAVRPLWVTPDGRVFLETFSPVYRQAYDFLIAIAEPVCRPECIHEYALTPHSLYAAVSVGLRAQTIVGVLGRLSKVELPPRVERYIVRATRNCGKAKLVLRRNAFWVEAQDAGVLRALLRDPVVSGAKLDEGQADEEGGGEGGEGGAAAAGGRGRAGGGDSGGASGAGGGIVRQRALREHAAADLAADALGDLEELAAQAAAGGPHPGDEDGDSDPEDFGPARRPPSSAAAALGTAPNAGGALVPLGGGGAAPPPQPTAPPRFMQRDAEEEDEEGARGDVFAFRVRSDRVEAVRRRCLPPPDGALDYPLLEEYDFRNDPANPDAPIELKPAVQLRPYQEKSLSKMFGNGRARSGVIVLPCGAGKSLVGVAAAARVRKATLCLCTSSVSVDQWRHQFLLWTGLQEHQVARFTAEAREPLTADTAVVITTFTMVAHGGKRSEHGARMMASLRSKEWGLMLLDEVHVVPAAMFRKVLTVAKAHCKLGLTATLVREDARIGDLNFLIGPKLYEANWLDLTRAGHIANVQCAEVWCDMTREFFAEYLKEANAPRRQLLYVANPNKFMACQFLVWFHEVVRGDKVIVFSDNIWALREYAVAMGKPYIYGPTSHAERTRVLHAFKHDPRVNTVFLSKVGDNSLDIPEANVLIQISSHAGSRRQEAQRLGRILRAKRVPATGPAAAGGGAGGGAGAGGGGADGGASEYNAFFYTLVSRDTGEMYFSQKRQQFLVDQGYAFKVVANLLDPEHVGEEVGASLRLRDPREQRELLSRILTHARDSDALAEADTADDLVASGKAQAGLGGGARRLGPRGGGGGLAGLSGGRGLTYMEYATGGGGGKRGAPVVDNSVAAHEKRERAAAVRRRLGIANK